MLKKISIGFVILAFIVLSVLLSMRDKISTVVEVYSPTEMSLVDGSFVIKDFESFDSYFSIQNEKYAESLGITKEEAFILGNLAKYWAINLMSGREVFVANEDLIYDKRSYKTKFFYSGFCLQNEEPCSEKNFQKQLKKVRNTKYKIVDLDTEIAYGFDNKNIYNLKNYVLVPTSNVSKNFSQATQKTHLKSQSQKLEYGKVGIFFADSSTKTKPDRECSSDICKEILSNINSATKSIDIAIYGYSRVPEIESALSLALSRGVKIRLVYDIDSDGKNIYPDTSVIASIITENNTDAKSIYSKNIMHNKFYVFDNRITITGSANLSHTDMSGFNSNSIVVIDSEEVASIYKQEFEQMYNGKFHREKQFFRKNEVNLSGISMKIFFSPQDKTVTNALLPLINNAKSYIYIPIFVLTEKQIAESLIKAKNRGVDVKIIIDALSASNRHSKHETLRANGVLVKTETYAGKMHSKSMIIDDEYVVVGSMNFSNSGNNYNDENLVLIKDKNIAKFYKEFFLSQWSKIDNKWLKFNAKAEGKDSLGSCFDGIDNDYDGLVDFNDSACK